MLVNEFLEKTTKRFPEKVSLVYKKKRITYSEIEKSANSLANALINNDLQKQDRVAIYLENSVESVISIFGILKASGVFVIINPQVKSKKLKYILNDCQVKILITDTKHLKEISNDLSNYPNLNLIITVDEDENLNSKTISLTEALKHSTKCPQSECKDNDLASIIYTSGSTGHPKGVMLTHLNMVSAAESIIQYLKNTSDDIIINCLPLSFDYGLYQILMTFKSGGTVILEKSFLYPYTIIDLIIKEKVTGFPIVPAIAAILLKLKNLQKYDFSSLRYITSTAQALPTKHITDLKKVFPHVDVFSMYGLTECKRVSFLAPDLLLKKPTSVGKAMPNVETFIIDNNGKKITKPGEIGELVIKGSNIMKGYWNLPDETNNRLKIDPSSRKKILLSGDLFKMDDEGFLYFIARKDDIIKTAGELVSPKEIENVLYEIEDVKEAVVIGIADEIMGYAIKAIVVLNSDSKISVNDIILHCSKNLENFMVPKFVEIIPQLPKTLTGKIDKKHCEKNIEIRSK